MRGRHALLPMLLLGAAIAAQAQDPPPPAARMIYDVSHGEGQPAGAMAGIAKQLGLEIVASAEAITADLLKGAHLLYLRAPSTTFTTAEKEAIVAFVKAGGSLLLVFDEEQRQSLAKTGVNDLIAPFGMKPTEDTPYVHNCGALAKAGEVNAADREVPYSGGRAVEGGTAFAWQLDKEGAPAQPFAAYSKQDNGARVIVMAEAMASLFLGTKTGERLSGVPRNPAQTTYWGKDSVIFMQEAFAWLIGGKAKPANP